MLPLRVYGVPYITLNNINSCHSFFDIDVHEMCNLQLLSIIIKLSNKDLLALIFQLLTFVCRYSHGHPVLALPSTLADIFTDIRHSLLMSSNDM